MKKVIVGVFLVFSANANAVWINTAGTIEKVYTYASRETVLVEISSPGTDVVACSNKTTFAISKDISPEARARMYAMLLAAQATGREVVVSYNDVGGCEPWDTNPSAYRIIARLR